MTSWRDVLRERQLAIDAADQAELNAKKKYDSPLEENTNLDNSCGDVGKGPELLSSASWLIETDVPNARSLTADNLQDICECDASPESERLAACSDGVRNFATDQGETASANTEVIEVICQSSPAGDDSKGNLKSDIDCAADAGSLHSLDCIESDEVSSSVIDSTPEHLVSATISPSNNTSNYASDGSEAHFADELPEPLTETAISVDSALDVQSPVHKRTRRHARKNDTRAKRKNVQAVGKDETLPACVVVGQQQEVGTGVNDYRSKLSALQSTSQSEQLPLDASQSQPSEEIQHFIEELGTTATNDLTTQLFRQASYLKAVGTVDNNTVRSQQPSDCTSVAESTVSQTSKDHLSSHESTKIDST